MSTNDMANVTPAPRRETDIRVLIWFFSWLFGFFVCSGGFVLLVFSVPSVSQFFENYPWIIVVCVALGFLCIGIAIAPFYFGIRCRRCRSRLRPMAGGCDLQTGNAPLRFFCEACNVIWDTKLVSGPGDPNSSLH